jgi:hypothetical protein
MISAGPTNLSEEHILMESEDKIVGRISEPKK